jgi:hypothetical protein
VPPRAPRKDAISLTVSNLRSLTLWVKRAHVDCHVDLHVTTDGPLDVTLAGCARILHFGID